MAIQDQTRIIQQRGTKAAVEAYTATLEEGAIAYATDTGEIGIYTGGAWVWKGAPVGQYKQFLFDVVSGDLTFLTDADGNPIMVLLDLE